MIVKMPSRSAEHRLGQAVFVEASVAEAGVGGLIVVLEVEAVLDQRRASKGVIADAVAADPGIEEWKGNNEQKNKPPLEFVRT